MGVLTGVRNLSRTLRLLVGTSVRVAPWQALLCLGETGGVILGLLQPLYLAWFVAGAVGHDTRQMALAAGAFVAQIGVGRALVWLGMNARFGQLERVGYEFDARIAALTASVPTIDHLDDPHFLDQLQIMREERGSLGLALNTLLNNLNGLAGVVGVVALAATADPRMLLAAVAGIPGVLAGPILARWQGRAEAAAAEPGRLAAHLLQVGTSPAGGGEVRVFGLADPLRGRLADATHAWWKPKVGLAVRESVVNVVVQVIFFGVAGAMLAWLVHDAVSGAVSVASVTLALLLVGRLQGVSGTLRDIIHNVAAMSRTAGRYLWLVDETARIRAAHHGVGTPPDRLSQGLVLEQVGYRYPGHDRPALDGVSLVLPAGSVVALVGENGAGKSTLVNLITGMLRPTSGAVRVDGRDLTGLDPGSWRSRLAGAFQDHQRWELTLGQSVGIGDLPKRDDEEAIRRALHEGAAEAVLTSVPRGLHTQLGVSWPDGVDLSGGQWQRLAIARGMMRRQPLVRVLDEPTAALDAATEHQLFDQYARAASGGRQAGTITILVTHRFSTVAAADQVVVLDHGRVVEHGTHAELISRGGHYSDLYELQARGYR
ncbi:ATP-binding cassette, subfamily B [Actinopolymorpha cephalotaxi]|uniref:ATP-binding cassette subfamily B protein n=1 Tax=Actinopolymorpha cephalotaxi TaxID=504797 RepID=A0A1I3A9Q8_9ACTN|nr:ABC transporter ATP-binding protein [Actinopolymorpha cephalotaxi]NYH85269.1 ATP-binding cassette subfamily B protein [Actinopolymorpha cephalotaxi]SFH46640.1 ATP-binding cassette, subfamily B [Actinopolymorpha cephalotaxi]